MCKEGEGLDIYIVIDGVGSFKLTEGPPGQCGALITYDNFKELEIYNFHFSDEEGGDDNAPMFSDSLIQPFRGIRTETDYVLSWWTVCIGSCLGIIILILLMIAVIFMIKKRGKSDKGWIEE